MTLLLNKVVVIALVSVLSSGSSVEDLEEVNRDGRSFPVDWQLDEFEVPRPIPIIYESSYPNPARRREQSSLRAEGPYSLIEEDSSVEEDEDKARVLKAIVPKGGSPVIIIYGGKGKRKYRGGGKGKGKGKNQMQPEYLPIHHYHHGKVKEVPFFYDPWGHEYNPKQPPPQVLAHIMQQKYKKTYQKWYGPRQKKPKTYATLHGGSFGGGYWKSLATRLAKGAGILGVADYDSHHGKPSHLLKDKISYHSGFFTEIY